MSNESSLQPNVVAENAAPSNDPSEFNQVEGVDEMESLCMNCYEDVRWNLFDHHNHS
jgi:hypothetical protein